MAGHVGHVDYSHQSTIVYIDAIQRKPVGQPVVGLSIIEKIHLREILDVANNFTKIAIYLKYLPISLVYR